jgi:hypothetical protein
MFLCPQTDVCGRTTEGPTWFCVTFRSSVRRPHNRSKGVKIPRRCQLSGDSTNVGGPSGPCKTASSRSSGPQLWTGVNLNPPESTASDSFFVSRSLETSPLTRKYLASLETACSGTVRRSSNNPESRSTVRNTTGCANVLEHVRRCNACNV